MNEQRGETGSRVVLARAVRSEFVRICGLSNEQRTVFAKQMRKIYHGHESALIINYEVRGWLEFQEGGIFQLPYERREKRTTALLHCVKTALQETFPH